MRESKCKAFISLIGAAALCASLMSACYSDSAADWDDTLPIAATEESRPTVMYLTEDTSESSEPITFQTSESTKRTAFSESGPELATTSRSSESSDDDDSENARTVSGIPNVPISEFTSTTPVNIAEAASS
ncbi:MAG: hypothetical protein K2G87_09765, partial [Oscillospiraceae bacterium]|nr:hypothetical protein [Oscillospiraceae bacterium]